MTGIVLKAPLNPNQPTSWTTKSCLCSNLTLLVHLQQYLTKHRNMQNAPLYLNATLLLLYETLGDVGKYAGFLLANF